MRGQGLIEIADHGQLLQVTIHPLIARHGEQLASFQRDAFVLGKHFQRIGQQRYPAHHRRLLPWLVNPSDPVLIGRDMFFPQVFGICERQSRHAAERKHIPYSFQPFVRHRLMDQDFQFCFGQVVFDLVVLLFQFVVLERVFLDPLIPYRV